MSPLFRNTDKGYVNCNIGRTNKCVVAGRTRERRTVSTFDFICPSSRCREGDCVVARREAHNGQWDWVTLNATDVHVKTSQRSPEITLVQYTPLTTDTTHLELWCFTKEQMKEQPSCAEWEISYPPGKQQIMTCAESKFGQGPKLGVFNAMRGKAHPNSAIDLMIEFARERNYSNCWLCQHMPKSTHSSIVSPVPFNKVDYMQYNWNGIADRLRNHSDDCYTPSFPIQYCRDEKYEGLAKIIIEEINAKYLPNGVNLTTLLRITYVQLYTKLGFEYRMQLTLTQTNCSELIKDQVCLPQPYTPAVLVEALISVLPWFGTRSVSEVKVKLVECAKPLQTRVSTPRNCSQYIPPVLVNELTNVSICFQGAGTDGRRDVGHSQCIRSVRVAVRQIPLPERVYMVCGGKAYSCVPYDNIRGTCYLAYLIPMIRKVATSEIAALYAPLHRHKRTLTVADRVFGTLLPWYGIYVTQQEVNSLSKVLEAHLNASAKAMLAEHRELTEVKNIALQNRMALDLLLAAQGGTCRVISVECCTYVSDATQEVMDMVHNTEHGISELHKKHGFNLGDISGIFGNWGAGLVKFVLGIAVLIVIVCLLGSCVVILIKIILKKCVNGRSGTPSVQASSSEGGEMMCTIADTYWRPPVPNWAY